MRTLRYRMDCVQSEPSSRWCPSVQPDSKKTARTLAEEFERLPKSAATGRDPETEMAWAKRAVGTLRELLGEPGFKKRTGYRAAEFLDALANASTPLDATTLCLKLKKPLEEQSGASPGDSNVAVVSATKEERSEKPYDPFVNPPHDLLRRGLLEADVRRQERMSVAVLGAGVSGLVVAFELAQLGHSVSIYEKNPTVGGRIRTHRFCDGTHAELGAMRVPSGHTWTRYYIGLLGLNGELAPFENYSPKAYFHFDDSTIRLGSYKHLESSLAGRPKGALLLFDDLMRAAREAVPSDDRASVDKTTPSGKLAEYDRMSLYQFLYDKLGDNHLIELITSVNGMHSYLHSSLEEAIWDYGSLASSEQSRLTNGMDRLPFAFRQRIEGLGGTVYLNTTVRSVHSELGEQGVCVRLCDGDSAEYDYVVCALPPAGVKKLEFTPKLGGEVARALGGLHIANSAKTVVHCRRPFWRDQGIETGGGSFTDTPIQQVWYPTGVKNDEACTLTASYTWEDKADFLATYPEDERLDAVLKYLEELHPGCRKEITDAAHVVWSQEEGGAFAYFNPGDHQRFIAQLAKRHPQDRGRVFFAGEHLSHVHGWIQGALISGLRAVYGVLHDWARGEGR